MKSTDRKILILVASLALLLAGCGGGSSTPPVEPGPTQGDMAISNARSALSNAEESASSAMTDEAKLAAYREVQRAADNLVAALTTHGGSEAEIAAAAGKSGNAKAMADILAQKIEGDAVAADAAMTALAVKLYDALGTDPLGQNYSRDTSTGTRVIDTGDLVVQIQNPFTEDLFNENDTLKEDKTAMVAPLHGWTGSKHTATVAAGTQNAQGQSISPGTYTAHMYSNVEAPTPGKKFGGAAANDEYEYGLTNKAISFGTGATDVAAVPARIAFTDVTRTAGTETFKLPESNPAGLTKILVPGSYHGVSGTYSCTPASGTSCTAAVAAAGGFTLGAGTWTFTPGDPNDRVMSAPDTVYPVYGWWQHEASNGTTRVSAFTGYKGTVETVAITVGGGLVNVLNGTATYKGGAAGIYALQSSTGGTNDAGHFTADAELRATFSTTVIGTSRNYNHKIEGTIDNFMGSDGMSRDWSVELKQISIGDNGDFRTSTIADGKTTTWSIGGTAAGDSGEWEGDLYKQNDADIPTAVTGRFHSEYGNAGRMVGAFGVNLEE